MEFIWYIRLELWVSPLERQSTKNKCWAWTCPQINQCYPADTTGKKWESSHLTPVCKYLFLNLWKSAAAQKMRRTHSYLGLVAFVNYLFCLLGTLFLALATCRFSDLWFQNKTLPRIEYWVQQHKAAGIGQAQDMKIFMSPMFRGWMNTEQSFCTIIWLSAPFSPCLHISSAQQWIKHHCIFICWYKQNWWALCKQIFQYTVYIKNPWLA